MKIGIMSDSHDNLPAIMKAVSFFNEAEVDRVLHAGDLISPFVSKPLKHLNAKLTMVFGNNDGERLGLSNVFQGQIFRGPHTVQIADKKILLMHEPDNLDALIRSDQFDGIVYGHTHEVDIRKGRCPVINPGECGGWVNGERTVAIWDMAAGDIRVIPV